jgi:hypothetical protein
MIYFEFQDLDRGENRNITDITDTKCGKKVKFTLKQATKAQKGSRYIALLFF